MTTWAVFQCKVGNTENYWAWCKADADSPGFTDIGYTERDGVTPYSPAGEGLPILTAFLFSVSVPSEPEGGTYTQFIYGDEVRPDDAVVVSVRPVEVPASQLVDESTPAQPPAAGGDGGSWRDRAGRSDG